MKRRLLITILVILIALSIPATAFAQNYYFSLDKEVVDVYWNSDGTMALDYRFTFTNQPSGHAIEYVDVGMPNSNFDLNSASAELNGQVLRVSGSDYQGTGSGFAVVLGSKAIQPGQTGTVHVYVGRVGRVSFVDDNDSNYASAVFAPTYFDSQFVTGNTDLTVTFHLPPGVKPEEPRWHLAPSGFPSGPQTGLDQEGRATYTWNNPSANAHSEYQFGASFPKSYVPADSIVTIQVPSISISPNFIFNLICFGFFGFMFLGIPILTALQGNRRKLQYMAPRISIEGHGIKRGLTAAEAAILMEQPLDKVMTMILFGVIKKNAAEVTTRDPLAIKATDPLPTGLNDYEIKFLEAFKQPEPRERRKALEAMVVALVRSVSEKMKGFSRRETLDYYKNIMERAWVQVEQADTPEVKGQLFDQNLEWTMLDKDYDDRTRRVFTGPVFVPMWWGRYDPTYTRPVSPASGPLPTGMSASLPSAPRLPGSDFAAQMVSGVQTFSQKVIGNMGDFTSRVTNVTNPPPKPSASSYRGGGRSGGCACACACAGCACACAGGGR